MLVSLTMKDETFARRPLLRRAAMITAGGLAVGIGSIMAPPTAMANVTDEEAIRTLLARIDAAWNAGDAVAFAVNWTNDGTTISPLGALSEGRANIQADVGASLSGPLKGSRHRLDLVRAYWPKAGVAVADGDAEISNVTGPDGEVWPPLRAKFTSTCVKGGSEWSIAHMRAYVFL
jgi:uncharacterized protein (TIGR02246 family)